VSISTSLQPRDDLSREPLIRARELVAFWYALWGSCERLNDVPLDSRWLLPWADDLAIFDVVDHGTDFRARQMGSELGVFLGGVCPGDMLSDFPLPYRQRLRQVLLRASISRAPVAEHYNWLVDGQVRSCLACAMPVSGGFYQPSHLLLAVFQRTVELRRIATADSLRTVGSAPETIPMAVLHNFFPRASSIPSLSRRSALAADS
jgi:hypothetical protein